MAISGIDIIGTIRAAGRGDPRSRAIVSGVIEGHPRLKTVGEFLEGITEQGCREIVESGTSLWGDILPDDWKKEILRGLYPYRDIFNEFVSYDSLLKLLVSAIKREVPWFDKTISPTYFKAELKRLSYDLSRFNQTGS